MAITKASLVLTGRDQAGNDIKTTLGYVNPDIIDSSDTTVVTTGKQRLNAFAHAVNGLTTNSLLKVELTSTEDITQ